MGSNYSLEKLKEDYKKLAERYELPSFEQLNREFYIEKITESETELLTREIRRFIADKIYNYMRFCETVLNPSNAPMFIFSMVKSLTSEDRKKLSDIYEKLSEVNMEMVRLDLDFSEKDDAEFIKRVYESWKSLKVDLAAIAKKLRNNKESKEEKNNNGYFG